MSVEDLGAVSLRDACRSAVNMALKSGRLVRPDHCSVCNAPDRKANGAPRSSIHGHHDDYTKPLDVRWLCARCHMQVHAPAISHGQRRSNVARRGKAWIDGLAAFDAAPESIGDDGICCEYDPALRFATAIAWADLEADDTETDGRVYNQADDGMQVSPFVKPHPSAAVLAAEVVNERRWQVDDLRRRVDAVRGILRAWRERFALACGWLPPEGRRLHEGCFRAGPAHKPSVERARAAAFERHARGVYKEAA